MRTLLSRLLLSGLLLCTCGPAHNSLWAQTDIPLSYPSSYISSILDVHVADDGSGLLGGTCGVLRQTTDGGQTWTVIDAPENNDLQTVACPPSGCATALLATNTAIYRRSGNDWTDITYDNYRGGGTLHWLTENLAINEAGSAGLWRSTDAGSSWTFVAYGDNKEANLFFTDETNGFVFARQELLKTTDGGASFASVGYTHPEFVEHQAWLDADNGWLFDSDRKFWSTTNGGTTWTLLNEEQQLSTLNWFVPLSSTHLVAAQGITKAESLDGGVTWTRGQYGVNNVKRTGLNFHRSGDAFYLPGDENQLLYSPAGFTDFTDLENVARQSRITDIVFATDAIGYAAAGIDLNVTTDGGTSWVTKNIGAAIRELGVLPNGDLIVLTDRETLVSQDQGDSFSDLFAAGVVLSEDDYPDVMVTKPDGVVYFLALNHSYRSTDGGATFVREAHNLELLTTAIHFLDDDHGFAVDRNGKFAKTSDGGQSWTLGEPIPQSGMESIYFTSENNGFAASAIRRYATTDGGQTWEDAEDRNGGYDFLGRDADGAIYAARWAASGENALVRSTDDGETWSVLASTCFVHRCMALTPNERYAFVAGDGFIVGHDLEALLVSTPRVSPRQSVSLKAFPNPSEGQVWVSLPEVARGGSLSVFDGAGRMVLARSTPVGQPNVGLDLSGLPGGVYSVRWVANDGAVGHARVVKR